MKINKEQFDALVAKLDALQASLKRYESISDNYGKEWVRLWEHILGRQYALEGRVILRMEELLADVAIPNALDPLATKGRTRLAVIEQKLDDVRGSGPAWTQGFKDAQGQILQEIAKKLDALQGKKLLAQFKQNGGKPKSKRKAGK